MLDFEIELESEMFAKAEALSSFIAKIPKNVNFNKAVGGIHKFYFSEMSNLQFLELLYEISEKRAVTKRKKGSLFFNMNINKNVKDMLEARQNPEFYKPAYIQLMGRANRKNDTEWKKFL